MPARSLSLHHVVKRYDNLQPAVDGVSLQIEPGEFVSFLGPSGSGKTTTLMMIAGFQQPTSGDIHLAGRTIDKMPAHARNIGVVFQNYALFPHMSVADNVGFPLRMRGLGKAEKHRKVGAALEMVGLGALAARKPAQLSGGQQQRVALARALVFEPDLILLDEPLGALDKNMREHMQVELKRIHRELGVTMVYVTHDQTEAMTMSDRIAVFNQGRIEQIAAPQDMYLRPATRFVASFIGDNNLISATALGAGRYSVAELGPLQACDLALADGSPVDLLLRPEMIRLAGDQPPCATLRIDSAVNYGDSVLAIGRVGATPLRVRIPGPQARDLRAGQEVPLHWHASDIHVIPAARA
ncbi:ABC transporter ATP-binding protein [Pseudomonas typographi]|uniref:ABC transporter ATP-binding protein n=1 Tax=Pseudomonas typographi TaxID=2715964 RepID=A0ABR7YVJ8_9PSED|nr:ABC transporter ATP-binding protein [Pseudomonas typographi]MBD1552137.1 ABC transporter ATP-binding protein [Pseudomonas typographi]MBD1585109.1 ABC transporter ATP-binding protein [Pseudomonas typographi]MBD1597156.1 ABC transporter ATP-binding protein [Pseudomonas typographi]